MKKEEYVGFFTHVAGHLYDAFGMGKSDVDIKVVYMPEYNGGENNEKLKYERDGDSGFDLRAQNNDTGGYSISPGGTIVVPVGIKVEVPKGLELQVRTRSGSPLKRGFNVANSPGTVN